MALLLLSQVFPPKHGGSGRWLWELYRRLNGVDVHVVAGDVTGAAEFDRTAPLSIERLPLDFESWGLLGARTAVQHLRTLRTLRHTVQKHAIRAIHCGKALPEGTLALFLHHLTGLPYVVYTHGEELTLAQTSTELRWLTRRVLASAALVVANSRHTQGLVASDWGVDAKQIVIMHPGVDTARFVPGTPDSAARARLGWAGRRVILTVGTLQKRKGQDTMIRALPQIREGCPDVLYAIAGDGPDRGYLEALVAELGVGAAVRFVGAPREDELVTLYQQCDLFALPNRRIGWDLEGFGIVVLEAQACGKPVVVGRSGGTPETVQPHITGEVVSCETPEPLVEPITRLLTSPDQAERMGRAGRQWAIDHFDWNVLAANARRHFHLGAC